MTVLPYSRGVPMAWDATIIHSCAFCYLHASASSPSAAAAAEERKKTKYLSIGDRISFVPFSLETWGQLAFPRVASYLTWQLAAALEPARKAFARDLIASSLQLSKRETLHACWRRHIDGRPSRRAHKHID